MLFHITRVVPHPSRGAVDPWTMMCMLDTLRISIDLCRSGKKKESGKWGSNSKI